MHDSADDDSADDDSADDDSAHVDDEADEEPEVRVRPSSPLSAIAAKTFVAIYRPRVLAQVSSFWMMP